MNLLSRIAGAARLGVTAHTEIDFDLDNATPAPQRRWPELQASSLHVH